jgi:hypothetical protein
MKILSRSLGAPTNQKLKNSIHNKRFAVFSTPFSDRDLAIEITGTQGSVGQTTQGVKGFKLILKLPINCVIHNLI